MGDNMRLLETVLELGNRHDQEAIDEHMAEDMTFINPIVGTTDKAGWTNFHLDLFAAFPDVTFPLERMVADGDTVVAQCTLKGTHKGKFGELPPTGMSVRLPVAFVVDFEGGKVKRWQSYVDIATMMRQLGAMK